MSIYYTQTLISQDGNFVPQPEQVFAFFHALKAYGSAPQQASFRVGTISGNRTGINPLTGETLSVPRWSFVSLADGDQSNDKLQGIDDYNAGMTGEGPPKNPPFDLYTVDEKGDYSGKFVGRYDFQVECCVRSKAVSMSDCHEEIAPPRQGLAPFGEPCVSTQETGFFHHPCTGSTIEVPGAACARFWIGFQCGKLVLPKIENDLNVLDPAIVRAAEKVFEIDFVQGCHWG